MPYNISPARNLRQTIYSVSCFLRIPDFSIFSKLGIVCLLFTNSITLPWYGILFYFAVSSLLPADFCLACLFKSSCHLLMIFQQVLSWREEESWSKKQLPFRLWIKFRCRLLVFLQRLKRSSRTSNLRGSFFTRTSETSSFSAKRTKERQLKRVCE